MERLRTVKEVKTATGRSSRWPVPISYAGITRIRCEGWLLSLALSAKRPYGTIWSIRMMTATVKTLCNIPVGCWQDW